jgi:hypothetical protein
VRISALHQGSCSPLAHTDTCKSQLLLSAVIACGRQLLFFTDGSLTVLLSVYSFGPAGSAFTREELVDAVEVVQGYC